MRNLHTDYTPTKLVRLLKNARDRLFLCPVGDELWACNQYFAVKLQATGPFHGLLAHHNLDVKAGTYYIDSPVRVDQDTEPPNLATILAPMANDLPFVDSPQFDSEPLMVQHPNGKAKPSLLRLFGPIGAEPNDCVGANNDFVAFVETLYPEGNWRQESTLKLIGRFVDNKCVAVVMPIRRKDT